MDDTTLTDGAAGGGRYAPDRHDPRAPRGGVAGVLDRVAAMGARGVFDAAMRASPAAVTAAAPGPPARS